MKYSKSLNSFIITVSVVAAAFLLLFGIAFMKYPESITELLSCSIAVASLLFTVTGIAFAVVMTSNFSERVDKRNKRKKTI